MLGVAWIRFTLTIVVASFLASAVVTLVALNAPVTEPAAAGAARERATGDSDWATEATGEGTGGVQVTNPTATFSISGDATGPIAPGYSAPINVIFTNPNQRPMTITDFSVTLQDLAAPRATAAYPCSTADFTLAQFSGSLPLSIPAATTISLGQLGLAEAAWPSIGMPDHSHNQNGCKDASITFAYAASGSLDG